MNWDMSLRHRVRTGHPHNAATLWPSTPSTATRFTHLVQVEEKKERGTRYKVLFVTTKMFEEMPMKEQNVEYNSRSFALMFFWHSWCVVMQRFLSKRITCMFEPVQARVYFDLRFKRSVSSQP